MKKFLPFVLPALVVVVIIYLGYSWYSQQTEEKLTLPEVTAGTEIEELSASELATLENLQKGVGNYKVVEMAGSGIGEIRYEIRDGKALFSVNANLATDQGEVYYLFTKEEGASEFIRGKRLEENKGGLFTSMAVAIDKLPITVQVRLGETVVLTGEIQAEE
jgi:hypothetical protein